MNKNHFFNDLSNAGIFGNSSGDKLNPFKHVPFLTSFLIMHKNIPLKYFEIMEMEFVMNENDFKKIEHITLKHRYKGVDIRIDNQTPTNFCFCTAKKNY